ncbi:LPS assembly lipoprotein LptE [Lysobacter sp. 5GHs7-4]|uniref:LPS-assembly lipoprotein LptE n=1 Tax=Lysobacter sp. 5GHs7-4 TaxID=2904253 RepID=UPI001E52E3E7|nr:LPS assembly lipoprotein LptE [Lysobacter sp. 5GHs7-4]UHQ22038.1 LPS assembly lipoprotein LptE [Lysobacter sp. 5GHs7-4]
MTRRPFIAAAAAALVLALSACGFQLRSALTLPPDLGPVRVVSVDRYSPLAESLAMALSRAGAVPATPETESAAVLDLLSERWGDTPVALDELGRTQEYSLRYAVIFELRRADGTAMVPRQTVELARDYVSNPVNSLGTEGEREVLQREMRREMTASVLRRIDAVVKKIDGGTAAASTERAIAPDAAQAAMEAAESVAPAKAEPAPPTPR